MTKTHILLLAVALIQSAPAADVALPLSRSPVRNQDKILVSDLQKQNQGEVCSAKSEISVPPGRYRLHMPLALAPLGDPDVSGVAVTLRAGDQQRLIYPAQFPASDVFEDFTLDFRVKEYSKPATVAEWTVPGKQAQTKRMTLKAPANPPPVNLLDSLPDPSGDEALAPSGVFLAGKGATVSLADAKQIPCRLMAQLPYIEPLTPIIIEELSTDRITYKPGDTGTVSVTLRNCGEKPTATTLSIDLLYGLAQTTHLHNATITLPPGQSSSWTGSLDTRSLYWGAEIKATATCDGFDAAARHAVFGVASNLWELAIMTSHQTLGLIADPAMSPEKAKAAIKTATTQGFTGFEAFFWAPCDMIDFTPDDETFFACQGGLQFTVKGTRNLIAAAHQAGMAATVYANLWGAAGPAGLELMRKHPDWFGQAEFTTYYLDDWSLMKEGHMSTPGIWLHNQINLTHAAPLFQLHSEEIIASHHQFGWDATRYDSYYSADWTKTATTRIRSIVEKEIPAYQWGYNSFAGADERNQALDIMVGGGGLIMEEGLGLITATGGTLGAYAAQVARLRDIIWPHRGHFGLVYKEGIPADSILLSTVLLAGGAHPYYGRLESSADEHAPFALRYSEFLWNNHLRPLKNPESTFTIPNPERFLLWTQFARTMSVSPTRQRLVLHLINAGADYQITGTTKSALDTPARIPAQITKLPVSVKLPPGARLDTIWSLKAVPQAAQTKLTAVQQGETVTFEVPEIKFWTVIVVDYVL